MNTQRRTVSIATCGMVLVSLSAARFVAAEPHAGAWTMRMRAAVVRSHA